MRLWFYWGVLVIAWLLQTVSIHTWPRIQEINSGLNTMSEIDLQQREDLFSVILYKPFHYLISILMILFFLLLFSYVLQKMIYECRVAYLLRSFPYEPVALLCIGLVLYGRILLQFPYTTLLFSLVLVLYELFIRLPERKVEYVYELEPDEASGAVTERHAEAFEYAERKID
jgi:hypothetical protein